MPFLERKSPPMVVVTGPTAAGKSSLALELAVRHGASIISADSVAVYRGFNIGASKPTPEELALVPHYLVSEKDPDEEFNAGIFVKEARLAVDQIERDSGLPLVAGGTGLYIRALVSGLSQMPEISDSAHEKLKCKIDEITKTDGADFVSGYLHDWLSEIDVVTAKRLEKSDRVRIERALLVYLTSGVTISKWQDKPGTPYAGSSLIIALLPERDELYARIDRRVLEMIDSGLLEEVRELAQKFDVSSKPFQSIGYAQALRHLNQEIDFDQMVHEIQRDTRRFAKRQLTWFRNEPKKLGWKTLGQDIPPLNIDELSAYIEEFRESRGIFEQPGSYFMGISR